MRVARLIAATFAALALTSGAQAIPAQGQPAAPQNLKPFLLSVDDQPSTTYSQTPSFAWQPIPGAFSYEFELAQSQRFDENTVLWSSDTIKAPTVAIPIAIPWVTGNPFALWARVRAVTKDGTSPWSTPYGFNMAASNPPAQITDSYPGMVRWTPVSGATGYNVWFTDIPKVISTRTNAADEREYYDFHHDAKWTGTVHWRVRAIRQLYGMVPNRVPTVSYGPWSPVYTSTNPAFATGPMQTVATISDLVNTSGAAPAGAHALTPGFAYTGGVTNSKGAVEESELYRVYVFSDSQCVNVIFRGAAVGSPAYVPRTSGLPKLPGTENELKAAQSDYLLKAGTEGNAEMRDTSAVHPTELDEPQPLPGDGSGAAINDPNIATPPTSTAGTNGDATTSTGSTSGSTTTPADGSSGSGSSGSTGGGTSTTPAEGAPGSAALDTLIPPAQRNLPQTVQPTGAAVDLWDTGWPTGAFYWTVVPVDEFVEVALTTTLKSAAAAGSKSIVVMDSTGFAVGAQIGVGDGETPEFADIESVDPLTNTITLVAPLASAHAAGEQVRSTTPTITWKDAELPQDACAEGRVMSFGKESAPATVGAAAPYASGLTPNGLLAAAPSADPSFYGPTTVSWEPTFGADEYQVQWSPSLYPWKPVDPATKKYRQKVTYGTSTTLDLAPGTWYYKVRGLDFFLPGTGRAMSWSDPVKLTIVPPTFRVVSGGDAGTSSTPSAGVPVRKGATSFKSYRVSAQRFTLALPKVWGTASPARPVGYSTDFKTFPWLRYVGFEPAALDARASVGVYVEPGRGARSWSSWTKGQLRQSKQNLGRVGNGPVKTQTVKLAAGRALVSSYKQSVNGRSSTVVRYAFGNAKRTYVLLFATPSSKQRSHLSLFGEIAKRFRTR